jgi:hypothetical protein
MPKMTIHDYKTYGGKNLIKEYLHACRKQKGKAEIFELDKAISRAKDMNLL